MRPLTPHTAHQSAVGRIFLALSRWVDETGTGRAFLAPFDVVLSPTDVVEPDLLYLSNARLDRLTTANVQGAPDLAIEVLSPGTAGRDRATKRRIYERFGVSEYWLVDPEERTLLQVRFGETAGGGERLWGEAERAASPTLPGLFLAVGDLFAG
ncbi:MAG: Uma2 family endonuclease [Holophagales bacterium]|nr:MAG: Uma2 family endonuclease [Holophagales bacterium]